MAFHSDLPTTPVCVRVFGEHFQTKAREEAGTFMAYVPCVPAVGTIINVANVCDVQWLDKDSPSDFAARLRESNVLIGNGLRVERVALQLDADAKCIDVRVDALLVVDPTVG
jgi:hypothetical protein